MVKEFSLGFIFDATGENVLLVHKQKPAWQAGKINGIGGKIEEGESPEDCIARETFEEACLTIPPQAWIYLGLITETSVSVHTFMTLFQGDTLDARKGDHEEVERFPTNNLPVNCIPNLRWIIPFAQEQMLDSDKSTFHVTYSSLPEPIKS
ncbi:NUDIX domain-containing protein [Candidatus Woesebacteria bacterium]|nr:NUDIX domain-containing protein [Candidatus Woesebacteria bacterium]